MFFNVCVDRIISELVVKLNYIKQKYINQVGVYNTNILCILLTEGDIDERVGQRTYAETGCREATERLGLRVRKLQGKTASPTR